MNILTQLRKCKCVNHPYLFDGVEPEPFELGNILLRPAVRGRGSWDCVHEVMSLMVVLFVGNLFIIDKVLSHLHSRCVCGWVCLLSDCMLLCSTS